jgi:hypothetical protein
MSAKPLGFYGLKVGLEAEEAIDALPLHELTDLLDDTTQALNSKHYLDAEDVPLVISKPLDIDDLVDIDKIGLIRGLCDRIEVRLMETAK